MLSRRRRLLLHVTLALGMGVLSWLLIRLSSGGVVGLLLVGAASASVLVGVGFVVRFTTVLLSQPERVLAAEPILSSGGADRHWTEWGLMGWTALCIAALTGEACVGGLEDPQRVIHSLAILLIVGIIAMQAIRLVKIERAASLASKSR